MLSVGGDPPTKSMGTRLDLTLNTRSPTQCFEHSNDIEIKMALVFFYFGTATLRYILQERCGLLHKLLSGNTIFVDRGFDIK